MTGAEAALGAFTLFNAIRVVAYLPQIVRIWHDTHGATAVSISTWSIFTLANGSTAAYGLLNTGDIPMACVFAANAGFCAVIVGLTLAQRRRYRRRNMARNAGAGGLPAAEPQTT